MGPESSTQNRVGNMVRGMAVRGEDTTGLAFGPLGESGETTN